MDLQVRKKGILPADFYARATVEVATDLLGKRLVSLQDGRLTAGWIVETEAYLPQDDSACHAARGETPGNQTMFGDAGHAYVYPIHSRHCFNVVTQTANVGTAVLVRAIQPTCGIDTMMQRRSNAKPIDLCRGPGRLCQAMAIGRVVDGHNLTQGKVLWIDDANSRVVETKQVKVTERIGVTSAKELQLRFVVAGNRYVSGPKRMR